MPQISVIVPVYNVEKYLRRCIDSILSQTYSDFDLALVDDGSPDACPQICDAYAKTDTRVHVIHQTNGGLSSARNAGIEWALKHSDSRWLMFIDSDDWIHPRMLEILLKANSDNLTNASMCELLPTQVEFPFKEIDKYRVDKLTPEAAWCNVRFQVVAVAKLITKSSFETVRYPVGKLHEDEYTTYKVLFDKDAVSVVRYPLYYYYRDNSESITNKAWSPMRLQFLDALKKQIDFFRKNSYNDAYRHTCRRFVELIALSSKTAADNGYIDLSKELKADLKRYLRKYKKLVGFSHTKDFLCYETAYPIFMRLYWYSVAARKKIKRLVLPHNADKVE